MEHKIIRKLSILGVIIITISQSCYYDKEELIKKLDSTVCDTTNITFSGIINPIISNSCVSGCHGGGTPSAGIGLENHAQIKSIAQSGKLVGVINHSVGFSPMPKGGGKLTACQISQIEIWVNGGMLNN